MKAKSKPSEATKLKPEASSAQAIKAAATKGKSMKPDDEAKAVTENELLKTRPPKLKLVKLQPMKPKLLKLKQPKLKLKLKLHSLRIRKQKLSKLKPLKLELPKLKLNSGYYKADVQAIEAEPIPIKAAKVMLIKLTL